MDRHRPLGPDDPGRGELAAGRHRGRAAGVDGAGDVHIARRRQADVRGRGDVAGDHDLTTRGQGERLLQRGQGAVDLHAQARLGADHADGIAVEAGQGSDVHRERRRDGDPIERRHAASVRRHLPAAVGHGRLLRPDRGVGLQGPDEQVEGVGGRGVEPRPIHGQGPAAHVVADDGAGAVEHRITGGQGEPVGVDHPAARAIDARGIGHDHLGPLAGDLDVSAQPRSRTARRHLVEDDAGASGGEVRIGRHIAARLGVGDRGAVVEDQVRRADVEGRVLVVADAGRVGPVDGDDRRAVAGGVHLRAARGRRRPDDLRRPHHRQAQTHKKRRTRTKRDAPATSAQTRVRHTSCSPSQSARRLSQRRPINLELCGLMFSQLCTELVNLRSACRTQGRLPRSASSRRIWSP